MILGLLVLLLLWPAAVGAEWAVDVYGGAAKGHATTLENFVWNDAPRDVQYDGWLPGDVRVERWAPGPTAGARLWYTLAPWAQVGLDLGWTRIEPEMHFTRLRRAGADIAIRVNDTDFRVDLFGLSPQLRLEGPAILGLRPRLSAGPLLALSRAQTDEPDHVRRRATSLDLGVQANAGLALPLGPRWEAFAEYRYSHVAPRYDFGAPAGHGARARLDTSAVILGVTRRW